MKQFKATKSLIKTHKKRERAKKNALKILIKNRFNLEQMQTIKNCNTLILRILSEMLKNVKQEKID